MLAEAKSVCDYLVVGFQTDPSIDGRKPVLCSLSTKRYLQLSAVKYVDKIIPYDTEEDLLNLLKTQKIDIRIIGEDYRDKEYTGEGLQPVHYNLRRHHWSTTNLKARVRG
jgi:glycerol-3-phosphate cytidylyltransferase